MTAATYSLSSYLVSLNQSPNERAVRSHNGGDSHRTRHYLNQTTAQLHFPTKIPHFRVPHSSPTTENAQVLSQLRLPLLPTTTIPNSEGSLHARDNLTPHPSLAHSSTPLQAKINIPHHSPRTPATDLFLRLHQPSNPPCPPGTPRTTDFLFWHEHRGIPHHASCSLSLSRYQRDRSPHPNHPPRRLFRGAKNQCLISDLKTYEYRSCRAAKSARQTPDRAVDEL